jgi:hypothetical protein
LSSAVTKVIGLPVVGKGRFTTEDTERREEARQKDKSNGQSMENCRD